MAWKPSGGSRLILCLALLPLAGCREQEQIHHYLAPKESLPEPPMRRMLAVMVPRGQDVWFFKFGGLNKEVSEHEADFDAFIRSIHFKDQEETPLTWTTPPDWQRRAGPPPRYATLRRGPKGKGLEITITKLGPEAANVRQNVDRWRNQLGLEPLNDEEFRKLVNNSEVDGIKATRVDLVAALKEDAAPKMGRLPQGGGKEKQVPFRYVAPDGWEARPPIDKQGVPIPVVFRVPANGEAEATAMSLPGDGGGLALNVNRWRRQAGLPPVADEQIRRDARTLKVGDTEAVSVDLSGPGLGAPKRILGVLLPHGKKETWFFTLKGPPEVVGKEQSHFEAFVKSVRFDGEAGVAHE